MCLLYWTEFFVIIKVKLLHCCSMGGQNVQRERGRLQGYSYNYRRNLYLPLDHLVRNIQYEMSLVLYILRVKQME